MSLIDKYIPKIAMICASEGDLTMVAAPPEFPFKTAYPGQIHAIEEIRKHDEILLASSTGTGKTAVYLSATVGEPSLIIEPRKFLQQQVAKYRNDCVVFGRGAYPCIFTDSALDAPCRGKREKNEDGTEIFRVFDKSTGIESEHPYPCPSCDYLNAVIRARQCISSSRTVICNFGNFWPYLNDAKVIIIDEADLFFSSVSSGKTLKYIDEFRDTTKETLSIEADLAKKDYDRLSVIKPANSDESKHRSKALDKAKNHYLTIRGFLANSDLCFQYKKDERLYVEIRPDQINELKKRIFQKKTEDGEKRKIIVVTATPGELSIENVVRYDIFMRTAVFYTPVGLMTAKNISVHPELLVDCAEFIREIHEGFKRMFGESSKKTIIHCGNLGTHAAAMERCLGFENCTTHRSGKLMESIEEFKQERRSEYLLVCAAEHGADFTDINHQFILKVPFASLDPRLQAYKKEVGPDKFNTFYNMDAMSRLVQEHGRIGRGAGSTGFTFILDKKFAELYGRYHNRLPQSFISAVERGGTL